jgi:hypothetical protein
LLGYTTAEGSNSMHHAAELTLLVSYSLQRYD